MMPTSCCIFMAGIERLVEESQRGRELLAQMQKWFAEKQSAAKT